MAGEPLNAYTEQIQAKEKADSIADAGLIDEEGFRKNYEGKRQALKATIDRDADLPQEEKAALWGREEGVMNKHLTDLKNALVALDITKKDALKQTIENLNFQAL